MIPQLDFILNFAVKQSLTHGCAKNVSMISSAFQASTEAKLVFDMNSLPHKNKNKNKYFLSYVRSFLISHLDMAVLLLQNAYAV